jgi:hypothetical protein
MSQATKENIIAYLGKGYKPADVAKVFNVSQGYISQVISDPDVKSEILALQAQASARAMKIDETYLAIEEKAVDKIADRIDQGFYKPMELLAVAAMANKASRKFGPAQADQASGVNQTISIILPENLAGIEITATPNNHVVQIGNMSLRQPAKQFVIDQANNPSQPEELDL